MWTTSYNVGQKGTKILLDILFNIKKEGLEKFNVAGPAVVVSNHASVLDPLLIVSNCPRHIDAIAKKELWEQKGFLGKYLHDQLVNWGTIPVDREKPDRTFFKKCETVLKNGDYLLIFPQGTRNKEGKVSDFKNYCGVLSCKYDVPIIPVGVTGTHKINKWTDWFQRKKLGIKIGDAIRPGEYDLPDKRNKIEAITYAAENSVYELVNGEKNSVLEEKINELYKR